MKNLFANKNEKVIIVFALLFLTCIILLIPAIRFFIIDLAEQFIIHRKFTKPDKWANLLLCFSFLGISFLIVSFTLFIFMDFIGNHIKNIKWGDYITHIKNHIEIIKNETCKCIDVIKKPAGFMFGLYVLGIISILRANFLYIDDLGRTIYGYRGWENFSRHIYNFLAIFIHVDTRITDISPLPQLFAALFLAIASVLVVYIFSNGKITKIACFAGLPIGLSPYFLECFSYKFDSPYMALSVMASVFPFLFVKNHLIFSIISVIAILIMSMSYQVSSGIYILMVIVLCFRDWNENKNDWKKIIRFMVISALSYIFAMAVFRLFFMSKVDDYVSTSMYPVYQLIPGVFNNLKKYLRLVNNDFSAIWKILLLFVCGSFIIKSVLVSKRVRILSLILSIMTVAAMCVLSFGVYLFLSNPLFAPRGMYGFGVFMGIIGVYTSIGCSRKILAIPAIALCWCFFVFSFSYGNALSDQKRYNDFRTELLLHDLAMLFSEKKETPYPIRLIGSAGYAPSIQSIAVHNPIIQRLVPVNLAGKWVWSNIYLEKYYNFNLQWNENIEEDDFEIRYDSYYHTIKSDGERILVVLK